MKYKDLSVGMKVIYRRSKTDIEGTEATILGLNPLADVSSSSEWRPRYEHSKRHAKVQMRRKDYYGRLEEPRAEVVLLTRLYPVGQVEAEVAELREKEAQEKAARDARDWLDRDRRTRLYALGISFQNDWVPVGDEDARIIDALIARLEDQ